MIHVLDAMTAKSGRLGEVRVLLRERYLPGARARGMRLLGEWMGPGPAEEWILLWGVDDVAAWWGMRAQASVDPAVSAFWHEVDTRLEARSRRTLPARDERPEPPRRTRLGADAWRGERATALLTLPRGVGEGAGERLEELVRGLPRCVSGCVRSEIGRNLPGTLNGGDYTLDLLFEDAGSAARWLEGEWSDRPAQREFRELARRVDAAHYAPLEGGLDAPGIASPVKRTLLLRVEPGAAPERVARLERELAAMPDHVPAIRNWHFARVAGACVLQGGEAGATRGPQGGEAAAQRAGAPVELGPGERSKSGWTHLWAQEFEKLDGLQIDYMVHPYHWSVVDRWFDCESPERIVAPDLAHAFCAMPRSVLA